MRYFVLLCLVSVAALGCAQMRYSGRYQEVKIASEPPGATVIVEGAVNALGPVAVETEGGVQTAYGSEMRLKTPVVLILDKENPDYQVKIVLEGYPEYEKELKTRFAFHPYLVVLFPLVPFWSNYEIKRFDDIFVDFEQYKAEREANQLSSAREEFEKAEAELEEICRELQDVEMQLEANQQELVDAHADESKMPLELEDLTDSIRELQERREKLIKEKSAKEKALEELRARYENLEAEQKAREAEAVEGELEGIKTEDSQN